MIGFLRLVGHVLVSPFKTRTRLEAEIILLRHQLNVLRRRAPAERLIGSIRRECFDHIVIFGGAHLRRILAAYTGYYNELRTHLTLDKDSRVIGRFSRTASSLRGRSLAAFIINTAGCSYRQGQGDKPALM